MVNDSGDSPQATPEREQTAQVMRLQTEAPPAGVVHPAGGSPWDAATWPGQHKASLFPPVQQGGVSGLCCAA